MWAKTSGVCVIGCLMISSTSLAWLGDRSQKIPALSPEQKQALFELEIDAENSPDVGVGTTAYEPWIAPEQILEQRKRYREKLEKSWPNYELPAQQQSLTYYSDDFRAAVTIKFALNTVDITVPRVAGHYQQVRQYLQQLLRMKTSTLRRAMADELLLDAVGSNDNEQQLDVLVLAELFASGQPSERQLDLMAHRLMKSARIEMQQQSARVIREQHTDRVKYSVDLPPKRLELAARRYKALAQPFADEYQVPISLVLAVIHAESHFNPLAQSKAPAYGLMQIMPATAGHDAAVLVFEKSPELTPDFLFAERNNIKLGAAYLHILYYRYLEKIEDEQSRALVTIAAYNAGPSNLARAFITTPRMSEAVAVINQMSSTEVLGRLLNYAPAQETRDYLKKVVELEQYYARKVPYWQ